MHALKRKTSLSALKFDRYWVCVGIGETEIHALTFVCAESIVASQIGAVVANVRSSA
jgi:hypothetical protein